MSDENEQKKEHSKISIRIGNAQVELEGSIDNIKKLMDKELVDFTKGLEATTKQLPSSTEIAPKITPKTPEVTPEVTPKEKPVPPPSKPSTTQGTPSQTPRVPTIGKPPGKMSKKKILSRNAAIALVLVLVLLASLVSVIAIYVPMVSNLEAQVAEQNDTIYSLTSQNFVLESSLNQTASTMLAKNEQIANLTSQFNLLYSEYNDAISYYNNILTLGESASLADNAPITQDANASTVIWNNIAQYAGYIAVQLQSTSNTTYARVVYSSFGVNFDQNITLGESGNAAFPVLPGEILFSVGNTEPVDQVNANVTAIYAY